MSNLAIVTEAIGSIEEVYQKMIEAIKPAGFGILTRIDFDKKIKEKIGESINPCIIAGACNPKLAYEAYKQSSDVALLIPCNIVLTEIGSNKIRIEAMRPTQMLSMLKAVEGKAAIEQLETELKKCLQTI